MNFSSLPKQAFLPRRNLSEKESRAFIERRDQIYSLCTPDEQQCLIKLANLYDSHRHQLFARPNIFTQSSLAVIEYEHFPWKNQEKPNALVRGFARIARLITKAELQYGKSSQATFIDQISSLVDRESDDVLLSVAVFCRVLPVEIGFITGQGAFEDQLKTLANKCITSSHVSALRRFEAAHRCIRWQPQAPYSFELRDHMWRLLLEVANEDMESALNLVAEHWNQSRSPQVLISGCLHKAPELAYRLAVKFKPHHMAFAMDMLGQSIWQASFELKKIERSVAISLQKVVDASCQLLAVWTFESMQTGSGDLFRAMDRLFQLGNPDDEYWQEIPKVCFEKIRSLPSEEMDMRIGLLAQVIFYEKSSSALIDEAHQLFQECISRKLGEIQQHDGNWTAAVSDVCKSLSILEDKVLSFRNNRVAACPNHFLMNSVETKIHSLFERLLARDPANALQSIVALILALSNKKLICKYHQILRTEFQNRARDFPGDAGNALKRLIQYCGFSQVDDEMYRKELCGETFKALIQILEDISTDDAAIARTGIGWSPRGDV